MPAQLGPWFDALKGRFPGRLHRDEYQIHECPYCGNQKANCEVNTVELVFHCWACGVGGTVRGLFKDYGLPVSLLPDTPLGRRELLEVEREPVQMPVEALEVLHSDAPMAAWALRYLTTPRPEGRGMTVEEVGRYQLRYAHQGKYARRVIWPIYEDDELVYFVARRFMESAGRPYDYPEHRRRSITAIYPGTTNRLTIVLVEGVFEVHKIQRLGYSVMPLLGTALNPEQVRRLTRRNFARYVVLLDRDAVKKGIELADGLRRERLDAYYAYTSGPDSDEVPEEELRGILGEPRRPGLKARVLARMGRLE